MFRQPRRFRTQRARGLYFTVPAERFDYSDYRKGEEANRERERERNENRSQWSAESNFPRDSTTIPIVCTDYRKKSSTRGNTRSCRQRDIKTVNRCFVRRSSFVSWRGEKKNKKKTRYLRTRPISGERTRGIEICFSRKKKETKRSFDFENREANFSRSAIDVRAGHSLSLQWRFRCVNFTRLPFVLRDRHGRRWWSRELSIGLPLLLKDVASFA